MKILRPNNSALTIWHKFNDFNLDADDYYVQRFLVDNELSYKEAKRLQWTAIIVLYEACVCGNTDIIESVYDAGFSLSKLNMEEFTANFDEISGDFEDCEYQRAGCIDFDVSKYDPCKKIRDAVMKEDLLQLQHYTILANPSYIILDLEKNEKNLVNGRIPYDRFFDKCYEQS